MTREEILNLCEIEMQSGTENFYKSDLLNNSGCIDEIPCTEIVAEYILNHISDFQDIEKISREKPYLTPGHDKRVQSYHARHQKEPHTSFQRKEEHIAIELFYQSLYENRKFDFGRIIDYQTPLKNERSGGSSGKGKLDLLSVCGDRMYILELKKPDSKESMLRCLMEGYTYLKIIDKEKLLRDFSEKIGRNPEKMNVRCAPLVFEDSRPAEEWQSREHRFPKMAELAKRLGIDTVFIEKADLLQNNQYQG